MPLLNNGKTNKFIVYGQLGIILESIYWRYRNYGSLSIRVPKRRIEMPDKDKDFIDIQIEVLDSLSYFELLGLKKKININNITEGD